MRRKKPYSSKSTGFARIKHHMRHPRKTHLNPDLSYAKARQYGLKQRGMRIDMDGLIIFYTLNKIKEIELKRRVAAGKKVRVAFLVDSSTSFPAHNVYMEMLKEAIFEPFIVFYGIAEPNGNDEISKKYISELKQLWMCENFIVIPAYDKNLKFNPFERYKIDIIFASNYYVEGQCRFISNTYLNCNYLVCIINYGFNVANNYEYHYNNKNINTAWKYFVESYAEYEELKRYSMHFGLNAVLTGSPRLDDFHKPIGNCIIPEKIDNGKPIVIYAPHWSINNPIKHLAWSTFDIYHKYFFELMANNPDINFVLKPHPSLSLRLSELNLMTAAQFTEFCESWDSMQNGLCFQGDNFIDLFRRSDLLITDSGSFIFYWLPTEKPCMYLVNPKIGKEKFLDSYSPLARQILGAYHICFSLEDIKDNFKKFRNGKLNIDKLLYNGLLKYLFPYRGSASKRIISYLKDVLVDEYYDKFIERKNLF